MELREQEIAHRPNSTWPLRIQGITPGLAVDRLNRGRGSAFKWAIEAGDLIVACEPEIGHTRILSRLRQTQRTRLTMLRWHAGPAPEDEHSNGACGSQGSMHVFEVSLSRTEGDKLGIR